MRIDRWNAGRLRRYHFPNGSVAVVSRHHGERRCAVLPAFCHHASVSVEPSTIAAELRAVRA